MIRRLTTSDTMSADPDDDDRQPTRAEIERMEGPVLLEFGAVGAATARPSPPSSPGSWKAIPTSITSRSRTGRESRSGGRSGSSSGRPWSS